MTNFIDFTRGNNRWSAVGSLRAGWFSRCFLCLGNLQNAAAVDIFPAFRGRLCRRKKKKEGGEQHDDGEAGLQQHLEPGTGRPGYR